MLNRNSAITEKYNIGKYPFEDNIEIILSENRNLIIQQIAAWPDNCLLYTSPSPRDKRQYRMPSSA